MQALNDEDFIHVARYFRWDMASKDQIQYVEQRLDSLGYNIEYGCCGRNILQIKPRTENVIQD